MMNGEKEAVIKSREARSGAFDVENLIGKCVIIFGLRFINDVDRNLRWRRY